MERNDEIVIVGGGIAGLALAGALARDGRAVTVLEQSLEYEDRVRGESMQPWGVAEAAELGVLPTLLAAGARLTETWVHYDALVPTEVSLEMRLPVGQMRPDAAGSLNLRHPEACGALAAAAVADGVRLLRGVREVSVVPGPRPRIDAIGVGGSTFSASPRLVIGADGRSSTVRKQAGIDRHEFPTTHMIAGLLVDGLDDLELDHDFLATSDELFMATFRQHDRQLRVYLCPGMAQRHRFSGPGGLSEFLKSSAFDCLPFGERLATANPIGPLATYAGDDTWAPTPYTDGVVLIGDAAGYNSPIIGQGLSIALRDARLVRDALRAGDEGLADGLAAYAAERGERMRRLRFGAQFMAAMSTDDCEDRIARRAAFFQMQVEEPLMFGMLGGLFGGPENGPAEAFDGHLLDDLLARASRIAAAA